MLPLQFLEFLIKFEDTIVIIYGNLKIEFE